MPLTLSSDIYDNRARAGGKRKGAWNLARGDTYVSINPNAWLEQVESEGFTVLPAVFSLGQVEAMIRELADVLHAPTEGEGTIRSQSGSVYAARNLLVLWPPAATVWRRSPLPEALAAILGPAFGLVRVLFFDKPPDETWALPWHKDLTVAVRDNRLPSSRFSKPTRKAGVPHVEAPRELLEAMLTARIHLDDVSEQNGPLKVIPGSHRLRKVLSNGEIPPETIVARKGDVLLMRPLLEHSSGKSHAHCRQHRRVLHLEFAAQRELPDDYQWHDFIS
jgi:hypothetical protein